MKNVLSDASLWGFFLLPLIVLGVRAFLPRFMPWWLVIIVVALVGWLLVFGSVELHYAALYDRLQAYGEHAPLGLSEEWAHDTGRPFALLFGWAYALICFVPCLIVYGLIQIGHRLYAGSRAARRV